METARAHTFCGSVCFHVLLLLSFHLSDFHLALRSCLCLWSQRAKSSTFYHHRLCHICRYEWVCFAVMFRVDGSCHFSLSLCCQCFFSVLLLLLLILLLRIDAEQRTRHSGRARCRSQSAEEAPADLTKGHVRRHYLFSMLGSPLRTRQEDLGRHSLVRCLPPNHATTMQQQQRFRPCRLVLPPPHSPPPRAQRPTD